MQEIITTMPGERSPEETEAIMRQLGQDVSKYHKEQQAAPHDPLKVVVAGIVNEHMLHEAEQDSKAAAERTPGGKPIPRKKLQQMQNWAFKYKQRHPFKTAEQVQEATLKQFKVKLIEDESEPGS